MATTKSRYITDHSTVESRDRPQAERPLPAKRKAVSSPNRQSHSRESSPTPAKSTNQIATKITSLVANESIPPPLPNEPIPSDQPSAEDDGWQPVWDDTAQAFYFYNRFTRATQWENPRVPTAPTSAQNHDRIAPTHAPGTTPAAVLPAAQSSADISTIHPAVAGGYNPAIHGDYDPNADYAQLSSDPSYDVSTLASSSSDPAVAASGDPYAATAAFNRFTGRFQNAELTPENFNDENKSKRQMSAFFDVDAAANRHDGRSLKAERAGKKLSKEEVKAFRDKRKTKKEERRRAWLRD